MNIARVHTIVRGMLALAAAGSAPALHAAGYQGGAETTLGVDGGTIRDLTAVALSFGAVFYPQLTAIWSTITKDPRLDALEKRVAALEAQGKTAKDAEETDA